MLKIVSRLLGQSDATNVIAPRLHAPVPKGKADPRLLTKVKDLASWVDQLPLLNPLKTIPALEEQLRLLNAAELSPQLKLELVQTLNDTLNKVLDTGTPEGLRQLPLGQEQRGQMKQRFNKLSQYASDAYKSIIVESFTTPLKGQKLERIHAALKGAIGFSAIRVQQAHRFYEPVPTALFSEMHELYRLAQDIGIQGDQAIHTPYATAIIAALLDPYHLKEGEQVYWCELLMPEFSLAEIRRLTDEDLPDDGLWRIEPDLDQPARAYDEVIPNQTEHWLIDMNPIIRDLKRQAEQLPENNQQRTLERIAKLLIRPLKRKYVRHRVQYRIRMTPGLSPISYYLEHPERRLREPQETGGMGIQVEEQDGEQAEPAAPCEAYVLNSSEQGLLISYKPIGEGLPVGELIGLIHAEQNPEHPPMQVGVVRWIRKTDGARDQLGVETLPGQAHAVKVLMQSEGSISHTHKALLYILPKTLPHPTRLMLEIGHGEPGKRLTLLHKDTARQVVLGNKVNESDQHEWFALGQ